MSTASSGLSAYFAEERGIDGRKRPVVPVLVDDRDERFAEERIALASDLHEVAEGGRVGDLAAGS